ncbi:hypothetical protein [Borreliella lanei]|uniref:Uncharacterized protein n=1 Tax=Borreliella lanei TaxID=373540 RepID=A0A7X0DK15_9SPIR|nr:hypothetical protein [Borreliella lanei]MBB6208473.1 hypothetical protein [Borreliella lanei]
MEFTFIKVLEFKKHAHLGLPLITINADGNPPNCYKYFSESYIIKVEDLLKIITNL